MKKLLFVLMAALALSCNDNRSSERDEDYDGLETEETMEPSAEEDTSSTWDQDRDRTHASDRMDNDESGARSDTTSTWDRDRDNLEHSDHDRDSLR